MKSDREFFYSNYDQFFDELQLKIAIIYYLMTFTLATNLFDLFSLTLSIEFYEM